MTLPVTADGAICPRCETISAGGLFCDQCGAYLRDPTATVSRVSYPRRIFGSFLLEVVLFWLLLWVGWFIWLAFTAPRGRTPAKSLTSQYVIDIETGRAAGAGEMWLREFVLKGLGLAFIANVFPFIILVDGFWIFFDRDRKALHDIALKQLVVYSPRGLPEAMKHQNNAPKRYQMEYVWPWSRTTPPVPAKVQDVGEDLRELQRLRSEGLITDEEFEAKRATLVSRM